MEVLGFGYILLLLVVATNAIIHQKITNYLGFRGGETRSGYEDENQLVGSKPNPWVEAAPLIVAASTKDGVAMVAIHHVDKKVNHTEDWLKNYRGEPRIRKVDSIGTAILSAGWRPDAEWIAAQCRKIAAEELESFGCPASCSILAQDLSLWIAECAISDRYRVPCAVCLLASCEGIWLVDATGAHRVRAHAVGNGAKIVNTLLCKTDFSKLTPEEGLDNMLKLLLESGLEQLSKDSQIESAIIDSTKKELHRLVKTFPTSPT
eukprot:CAMPEP_0178894966 /NCGR_PEP_ID=MMETSP0786-20121207/312_1 /TAXON_ID=186022 /ORGANISM="Thalassionema frauenfeldii, Strain CCMP 1798" /LENGTH=262 /DNA_ID=CAMNT_0020565119 /DNA_START=174 /DNA_END=959 /DNA_ORIENTATION=+